MPGVSRTGVVPVGSKMVSELRAIVCLDTFNGVGKVLTRWFANRAENKCYVSQRYPHSVFVNGSILEEVFFGDAAVYKAGGRDKLHVNLNALSGMLYLFIGFGNILGIWRVDSHNALFFRETVWFRDRAGIASLHKLALQNHKSGMGISSAHICDESEFGRGMLEGMLVRYLGEVTEGFNGAVKMPLLAVNILSVGFYLM